MPYQPINFGNAMLQGEQINALRAQNDPNSLKNQILTEKLNALRNNPGAGSNRVSPVSFKDATAETLAEYQRTGNPGVLKRHYNPYKPWTVDTKTSREFWDINVNTREPELITSIPIENFTAAYDSAAGAAAVAEGLPNPNAAPSQPQQVPNAGLPPVAPQPAPYVPKSAAKLAGEKTTATAQATADVKEKVNQAKNKKAYATYEITRSNVMRAMEKTTSGYFAGKFPAVFASQQIADHANNVLFPAIKKLVREGEKGTFTDQDAIDVRRLMPTRDTHPDALPAVMWQLDSWVASNLGQPQPPMPEGMIERPAWIAEDDPRWNALSREEKTAVIQAGGQ